MLKSRVTGISTIFKQTLSNISQDAKSLYSISRSVCMLKDCVINCIDDRVNLLFIIFSCKQ